MEPSGNSAEDPEKREQLKSTYKELVNVQSNFYLKALEVDASRRMPKKTKSIKRSALI